MTVFVTLSGHSQHKMMQHTHTDLRTFLRRSTKTKPLVHCGIGPNDEWSYKIGVTRIHDVGLLGSPDKKSQRFRSRFPSETLPGRVSQGQQRRYNRVSMQDEQLLMQRIAQGDGEAVANLYDRFGALVYRMSIQMMPTRADAEEVVQEVFIRLWQSAERYDSSKAALVTWVMLITRRYLVDRLRRMRVRPQPGPFDEGWTKTDGEMNTPDHAIMVEERQSKLWKRIEALPDLQREVVERAYFGGKTLREIGVELDKPIGTVKSALSRALASLRDRVQHDEGTL